MKYLVVFVLDFSLLGMLHEGKRRFPYQFYPRSTPYNGLYGAAPPVRGTFSWFRHMKEHGFHSLKYMKGAGNLSFRSVKGPTGLRDIFYECGKSRENVLVLWFLHIFKTLHLKSMQSSKIGMWKGYHLSLEDMQNGWFFFQNWYLKGHGVGPRGKASPYNTLSSIHPRQFYMSMIHGIDSFSGHVAHEGKI